ncbi:MAG: glycine cleavage system aminomethyltransferase GcvT [Bacteroidia bacterium]|nr:glycine cleavage system aminomethyltransferase GcvT [Bacteroidia bacterium]MCX7764989.1 glycine cleavage system aminomethyltransferase GcvT [Bacteroidia bacterium]MDW8057145.1 glycine cleavage system aminomethyltransferase GcvT [Bacteroidia bacterium]
MLKSTPLRKVHIDLGAALVPFGGWEMPLRYKSELQEHAAVRSRAGVFDLSHMGEFLVRGPEAAAWLNSLLTNDLRKLSPGRAQYSFLLREDGGIIDDLIVYQLEPELFMLVVNAATTEKDWGWLEEHLPATGVSLENISEATVLIALSGPESESLIRQLTDLPVGEMPYYACVKGTVAGIPDVLVATTGYTGEWTYELFVRESHGLSLWEAIMNLGEITPAGLSARNTLRLEMGYLLYGTDIDEQTTPLEAGISWAVKLDKGNFIGREALLHQKEFGLRRRLFGLLSDSPRAIPRNGMLLYNQEGKEIGRITSGSISPSLSKGIALGYLPPEYKVGMTVYMALRGEMVPLTIVRPPFLPETSLTRRQKARV